MFSRNKRHTAVTNMKKKNAYVAKILFYVFDVLIFSELRRKLRDILLVQFYPWFKIWFNVSFVFGYDSVL